MGLFEKILGGGLVGLAGFGIYKLIQNNAEDKKRRNTPCHFDDANQQSKFTSLVEYSARHIKRLTATVSGHMVYGTVRSQSGISTWEFRLDFNDYGRVTGEYWCYTDNNDSNIPRSLGDSIKNGLRASTI